MNNKRYAIPARLDADRTAKPLNKIKVTLPMGQCFYGVKSFHRPELITDECEKIYLFPEPENAPDTIKDYPNS